MKQWMEISGLSSEHSFSDRGRMGHIELSVMQTVWCRIWWNMSLQLDKSTGLSNKVERSCPAWSWADNTRYSVSTVQAQAAVLLIWSFDCRLLPVGGWMLNAPWTRAPGTPDGQSTVHATLTLLLTLQ